MSSPAPEAVLLSLSERRQQAALTLGWPAALLGAPLMLSLGELPLCAFRQLTGQPCPLFGGTHACAALAQGDLLAAWQANPGLFPLFVIAAAHAGQLAWEAWSGRRISRWRIGIEAWQVGGLFLLGAWVMRLAGFL